MTSRSRIESCILGIAIGDALGLPYEGLSAERGRKLIGYPNRFHLLWGRGMVSDDTEHACIVAQCLIASAGDDHVFDAELAKRLRRWFLAVPAGIGRATFLACTENGIPERPARAPFLLQILRNCVF